MTPRTKISEYGQTLLDNNRKDHKIHLLSIIGEIEGHELPQHNNPQNMSMLFRSLPHEDSTD